MNQDTQTIELTLVVSSDPMAIPRCLQVLSRRQFHLQELLSTKVPGGDVELRMKVEGPARWRATLPGLLEKVTDVRSASLPGVNL